MATIYVDLDGTIVDVADRYWEVHSHLTRELGGPTVARESYWSLKRTGAGIADLWPSSPESVTTHYQSRWLALIELPRFLALDSPIAGAAQALLAFRRTHRVVLVAMRRNRQELLDQLEAIRLLPLLDHVLSGSSADMAKHELIMQDPCWEPENAIIVGDTEVDITAGRFLGIRSVAVLSGMRERAHLLSKSPDFVVDSIASVPAIVAPSMSVSRD